ncbi:MAG: ABC transporter ATP-binding protein [SAR324 cluster bacterium]|nr:ABC transporter ATP-binding protein [SAR324 cluster bacterium]
MSDIIKLGSFIRPYWKQSTMALILLILLVMLDLSIPRLIQRLIDEGIRQQNQQIVIHTGLLMLGISALSAVIAIGNNILSVKVGESLARDLREAIFLKIQSFSFRNLEQMQTGTLMVRLTSDTTAIQRLAQLSLRIGTRAPLLMIGSLLLMIHTSPRLALTLLPLLLITMGIIVFFVLKMEPLFRLVQYKLDKLNTVLQENVSGVRLIKAFVRADHEGQRFETANESFTGPSIKVMGFMSTMTPALTVCVNIGMVIVIWSGGLDAIRGDLTVGQIVAVTNYLLTTMTPLILMGMLSNIWASGLVSASRIQLLLDTETDIREAADARFFPENFQGHIELRDVSFHYKGYSEEPVLRNINLVVEPGQTLAILGATGAGKSTLINLIPRFYDVTSGQVLIDGQDIRTIRQESLMAHIAMVPQETILFSGSIRDNIRYGRPEADEDEVLAAAQAAQAHEFIQNLHRGYDTHIEERGVNFSGGQKQRIAIARALLMRPQIMILDDSTSAVDVKTETWIHDALESQTNPPTLLLVAQRISTVLKADRIVVLEKGAIAAQGTHQQLLQSSPIYQEIYESQLGNGVSSSELSGLALERNLP